MTPPWLPRIRELLENPPDPDDRQAARAWLDEFDATMGQHDPEWMDKLAKFMEAENGDGQSEASSRNRKAHG